jgi:hypothetical protein
VANHDRLTASDSNLDTHMKVAPIAPMPMRELDNHPASDDARVELFQPCDALKDIRLEHIGVRQAAERDLGRDQGHGYLVLRRCPQVGE